MRKNLLKIAIILVIFIMCVGLYLQYFHKNENQNKTLNIENININLGQNNQIKNLEYEVNLPFGNIYKISSQYSTIIVEDGVEKIDMSQVKASIVNNNETLLISSDKALINRTNKNSLFYENVSINYLDHTITSNNLSLNLNKNEISIFNNVKYQGSNGEIYTDNIKIDFISKKIDIFMNKKSDSVKILQLNQ